MLFLLTLLYTWVSGHLENVIYWPGAYFSCLWALSMLIPYVQSPKTQTPGKYLIRQALWSLLFGSLHFVLTGFLTLLLERLLEIEEHYTAMSLVQHFRSNWFEAAHGIAWYCIYLAVLYLFRLRELYFFEKRQRLTQTEALDSSENEKTALQLNPHFLFNSMNAIAMMVRRGDNQVAVSAIAKLNELLREVLYGDPADRWGLREELKFLESYITLEEMRFEKGVITEIACAEPLKSALVPKLILQPLVENAFKHGFRIHEKNNLNISVSKSEERLHIQVTNSTSSAFKSNNFDTPGIGISNVLNRLRFFYQDRFIFRTEAVEERTNIWIELPYEAH